MDGYGSWMEREETKYLLNVLTLVVLAGVVVVVSVVVYLFVSPQFASREPTPQPVVSTATQAMVAMVTPTPAPVGVQNPVGAPTSVPTSTPSAQVVVKALEGKETDTPPGWIEVKPVNGEHIFYFRDESSSGRYEVLTLSISGSNEVSIFVNGGLFAKICCWNLMFFQSDSEAVFLRINRKRGFEWIKPSGGESEGLAVFYAIMDSSGGGVRLGCNPSPPDYSFAGSTIHQQPCYK